MRHLCHVVIFDHDHIKNVYFAHPNPDNLLDSFQAVTKPYKKDHQRVKRFVMKAAPLYPIVTGTDGNDYVVSNEGRRTKLTEWHPLSISEVMALSNASKPNQ